MLGDDLLNKVANNVKNLSTTFDEIHPVDSNVIFNDYNIIKVAPNSSVILHEGDATWEGPQMSPCTKSWGEGIME